MIRVLSLLCVVLAFSMAGVSARVDQDAKASRIVVNGLALNVEAAVVLTHAYGPIPPGEYWYDPVSGLWGG